ncbi:MAG: KamA family protein [Bacteroidia bacterium]|nr:KamA family protein [Bacteroidia bacterium]
MAQYVLNKFKKTLPVIVGMAMDSNTEESFFDSLRKFATDLIKNNISDTSVKNAKLVLEMLEHEAKYIPELSRGDKIYIETFSMLWNFLRGDPKQGTTPDLFEDLFQILCRMTGVKKDGTYTEYKFVKHMKRWPTGLEKEIREKRAVRKDFIIGLLIKKIEKRSLSQASRYQFEQGMDHEQKKRQVNEWWNDFRFHLAMAIKTPAELNLFMEESLSTKTMKMLGRARNKRIPFFITPYYISLLNTEPNGFDDQAIRSYVLYTESLVDTYGNIKAWEREDLVVPGEPNAAGWLLPDGHNIHRRYPEVAIMIPDTRGRSCGGLCASCQRMYDFQSERLNFDLDALKPQESWEKKLSKLMDYFESDSQIRDILITGGDALMSRNRVLDKILDAVLKMAVRKKEANMLKAEGQKYYEIQRVRLGSRLLAYLPMRIDNELIDILKRFKEKGLKAGIRQFVIQTHFQSPLEITVEARKCIEAIVSAGWTISNQLVFTAAASRRGHTAKLRQALNSLGVVTYYTFTVKGFEENMEMFAPNSRSMQEQFEEKSFGKMNEAQQKELNKIFRHGTDLAASLNRFMKTNSLPFVPTDRNVLNLPAIGKSMTFQMVGISKEGKRILRFDHDHTREHSPIIGKLGKVYIIENRSVNSYLKEVESMGERKEDYSSIWDYTSGDTEQVFPLFNYPKPGFTPTKEITNYKETD